jgi:hypothetical protein
MRGRLIALAAVTAAIFPVAVSSGCGSPGRVPGPPGSARSMSRTREALPVPMVTGGSRDQARKAYLSMWEAFVAASATADYRAPGLARYAAGGAFSVLVHGLYANYLDGIVTRGRPAFSPEVTVRPMAGTIREADVTDCARTSTWASYTRSGALIGGQPHASRHIIARLQLLSQAGGPQWKVTYLNVGRPGTC